MASYHNSFTYLKKNSAGDNGLLIVAFEPDNGAVDTFLSMESISDESYDGTKRFDYGARYNSVATISITVIKSDNTHFSVAENREMLRWLTGCRTNSWLDFYEKDEVKYSFWGKVIDVKQHKLDARIIGFTITFESANPWAYSAEQSFNGYIGQAMLEMSNGVVFKDDENASILNITEDGVLYNDDDNENITFSFATDGAVYNDAQVRFYTNNDTDELYSYIYLNMIYNNENSSELIITNTTLNEETKITGISNGEIINMNAGQFIISDIPNKIFGDAFNFIWPRLAPGYNEFIVDGMGKGSIHFSYRHPIKIGDCAVDIENIVNATCDEICTIREMSLLEYIKEELK